jgi:hypothetical protein
LKCFHASEIATNKFIERITKVNRRNVNMATPKPAAKPAPVPAKAPAAPAKPVKK